MKFKKSTIVVISRSRGSKKETRSKYLQKLKNIRSQTKCRKVRGSVWEVKTKDFEETWKPFLEKFNNYVDFESFRKAPKNGFSKKTSKKSENNSEDDSDDFSEEVLNSKFEKKEYIPREVGDSTDVEIIKDALKNGENVLLVGETGTGKTHAVYETAKQLGRGINRANLNKAVTPEDLVGQWAANGGDSEFVWKDGILTKAVKKGKVFVGDEINAAPREILFILNAVLDERKLTLIQHEGEEISADDDFGFIATMNPESYKGVQRLNSALLDRFSKVISYDYDRKIERKLNINKKFRDFAHKVRNRYKMGEIDTPISTRTLLQLEKNTDELGLKTSKELLLAKFPKEERNSLRESFEMIVEGENEDDETKEVAQDEYGGDSNV